MNFDGYCISCFKDRDDRVVCPHCGYNERAHRREEYYLPARCLLNNRYIIGEVVGYGGFGIIYKAWDAMLNITVAVKELFPAGLVSRIPGETKVNTFSGDKQEQFSANLNRFLDEARSLALFADTPNIVNVYSFFEENNTAYIVMEFLDGITLKKYLEANDDLTYEDTKELLTPVLTAVDAMHKKNIIHRDISPDNIFITLNNGVSLMDFGAAKLDGKDNELTRDIVVKPGYTPPEQYSSRGRQGPWTDIYALGATAYRMVTGKVPMESIDRVVNDELESPRSLNKDIPVRAEKAILRSLALKSGLRFKNITEMRRAFLGEIDALLPEQELRRRRRRRLFSGAIMSVLLVGIIGVSSWYYNSMRVRPSDISPDSISIMVPTEKTDVMEELVEAFFDTYRDQYPEFSNNCSIDIRGSDNYTADIESSDLNPALFLVNHMSPEQVEAIAAPVNSLYTMISEDDFYLVPYYRTRTDSRSIPTDFDFPMVFVNTKSADMTKINNSAFKDSTDLASFAQEQLIDIAWSQEALDLLRHYFDTDIPTYGMTREEALDLFSKEDAAIYVGMASDILDVQNALPGYYGSALLEKDGRIVGVITESVWAINDDIDNNKKKIATLFLSFLLSEYGQQLITSGDDVSFSVSKSVFKNYATEICPEDFTIAYERFSSGRYIVLYVD